MADKNNLSPILITGGCGMVGSHLVDYYAERNMTVTATYCDTPTIRLEEVLHKANYIHCDITNKQRVDDMINEYKPEIIFHLAAQSYPTVSWEKPLETMDVNVNGTIHVMEAIKTIRQTDRSYDPIVLIACSSAEYGASLVPENLPAKESTPLLPLHPYGVSKVSQDLLGYQYYANNGIRTIRVRIFNTTGPRKTNDVVSDFTKRTVLFEKGEVKTIHVGTLETRRAITDVRDLISALFLLAEKGEPGETYNVSGGWIYQISDIITMIEKITDNKLPIEVDQSLLRSTDEAVICGDSTRLKTLTGWEQQYTLETTITDMINYWRGVL